MNKILKNVLVLIALTGVLSASEMAVVNTDILLIKKQPNDSSIKLGFYKMNDLIEIQSEDSNWYKTKKGYVKSEYLIKKDSLPKFLDKQDVDYSKFVIQLIVYNPNISKGLLDLQKTLIDEDSIYLQRTSKAVVAYVVNIDSYSMAKQKLVKIKKHYKSSFISNIKNTGKSKGKTTTKKKMISKAMVEEIFEDKPKKEVIEYNSDITEVVFTPASKSKEYIILDKKTKEVKSVEKELIINKPKKEIIVKKVKNETVKSNEKINNYSKKVDYYSDDEFSALDKNIEDEIGDFDIEKSMSEFDDIPSDNGKYKKIKKYVPKSESKKRIENTEPIKVKEEIPTKKIEVKSTQAKVTVKKVQIKEEPKVEKNFNSLMENILIGL